MEEYGSQVRLPLPPESGIRLAGEDDSEYSLARAVLRWPGRWSKRTIRRAICVPSIFEDICVEGMARFLDWLEEN